MRKFFITLAVLLLLIIAPYLVGTKAENHFKHLVERINQLPSLDIQLSEYNRGWFTSTATLEVTVVIPLESGIETYPVFKVKEELTHGPILWKTSGLGLGLVDSNETIELPEEIRNELAKLDSVNNQTVDIKSRIAFSGVTTSYLNINTVRFEEENNQLLIKPLEATLKYDMQGDFSGVLHWQGLQISDRDQNTLDVGAFTGKFEQLLIAGNIFSADAVYTGPVSLTIDEVSYRENSTAQDFKLSAINFSAETSYEQELIHLNVLFKIAKISALFYQFDNFIYDFSIDNLDLKAMQSLNTLVADYQLAQAQETNNFSENSKALVTTFLTRNPILSINNLGISTADGDISSRMKLSFDQDIYDVNDPESLFLAMQVNASGEAPELFFTKLGMAMVIEPMLQQNFLRRENQLLTFDFSFIKGQALLNDRPIPLPGVGYGM